MITDLLTLSRPLIVLDLETTGLRDTEDRIIEIAHQVHRPDGSIAEWRSYIDPGMAIPEASIKVHGITDAMIKRCQRCQRTKDAHDLDEATNEVGSRCEGFRPAPTFRQAAQNLARGYSDCDFAGKNVRFDLGFLAAEFRRNGVPWGYTGACVLDADRLEALAKPRHLSNLYKEYIGRELVDAHSALADVKATTEVIAAQLERHAAALPRDLRRLHELSWPGWVDSEGKIRMRDGEAVIQFGKHKGRPMRAVPRDYWHWILKSDFSDEFKALAEGAVKGRYPQ